MEVMIAQAGTAHTDSSTDSTLTAALTDIETGCIIDTNRHRETETAAATIAILLHIGTVLI